MKRIASAAVLIAALAPCAAAAAGAADKYPNYYAAQRALDRGDCGAAAEYLKAFLRNHPTVRKQYPDFYLDVRLVIGQCTGALAVRGIEGDSAGIDPLPEHPPSGK